MYCTYCKFINPRQRFISWSFEDNLLFYLLLTYEEWMLSLKSSLSWFSKSSSILSGNRDVELMVQRFWFRKAVIIIFMYLNCFDFKLLTVYHDWVDSVSQQQQLLPLSSRIAMDSASEVQVQVDNNRTLSARAIPLCRYGCGCTHMMDPVHREKFRHPNVPKLNGSLHWYSKQ